MSRPSPKRTSFAERFRESVRLACEERDRQGAELRALVEAKAREAEAEPLSEKVGTFQELLDLPIEHVVAIQIGDAWIAVTPKSES